MAVKNNQLAVFMPFLRPVWLIGPNKKTLNLLKIKGLLVAEPGVEPGTSGL